ncbi:MAG: nucleotidyltransferase family protein [Alphaproteobacteria bacterium]|nr:nucleotidyltransferase family protein [Alphaproteobacteria bacterium]
MNHTEFVAAALTNPNNHAILERLPQLGAPDVWLVSGAIFQTVWNVRTGRPPTYGIKDYDIFYFDPDPSWEAEDAVIKRADALFGDLGIEIEVRNQGRVHIWYQEKFGTAYPKLKKATDGIDRFLCDCAMVGMRPDGADYTAYAPRGFEDIESMTIRPNRVPNFHPDRYVEKAARWKALWPEITILPP